jgi:hypothetical protein
MRRVLLLVLCLLLPLQGFAAPQVAAVPCPMQDMIAMTDAADEDADTAAAMVDCCNDLATFERTGQPCKSAQPCSAPAVGMPFFTPVAIRAMAQQAPPSPDEIRLPPGAAARLWRPPASI